MYDLFEKNGVPVSKIHEDAKKIMVELGVVQTAPLYTRIADLEKELAEAKKPKPTGFSIPRNFKQPPSMRDRQS